MLEQSTKNIGASVDAMVAADEADLPPEPEELQDVSTEPASIKEAF